MFLGIYPFLLGCPICWHIAFHNILLQSFVFLWCWLLFLLFHFFFFFLKILFIYLTEIETFSEIGNTSSGCVRGRSRLIAEEPDVGLHPITLGSRPEPKADA